MKNSNLVTLATLLAFTIAGCGSGKKNPVGSDLKQIREQGKASQEMGDETPIVKTETIIVTQEKEVVREESTLDDKFLVITPDPEMSFNEGKKSSYKIRARALTQGVQIKLTATGLPDNATLQASPSEKDLYLLSWTPALYTVPSSAGWKSYQVKLILEGVSSKNSGQLVKEKEISLLLFRNQEPPSDLKIVSLPTEILEGQEVPFSVTVKIPGMDDKSPQKPNLMVNYDGVSLSAGNSFLELSATPYIIPKKDAEYMGDFQWKFKLVFDTKNIPVQRQLAKDGSIMPNADGTRARVSFKVYNRNGQSTPETLFQIKIKYSGIQ